MVNNGIPNSSTLRARGNVSKSLNIVINIGIIASIATGKTSVCALLKFFAIVPNNMHNASAATRLRKNSD